MEVRESPRYVRELGCLRQAAEFLAEYGSRVFVLGGETALEVTEDVIWESLLRSGLEVKKGICRGYCSEPNVSFLVRSAIDFGADLIVGVGGGRALDTSKEVADALHLPVATIPTIAATCAAWTPLSIMYDDSGTCLGGHFHAHAPRIVLVDTQIIAEAPTRYLAAGIGDSMAKWFEPCLVQKAFINNIDCFLSATLSMASGAYNQLLRLGKAAVSQCEAKQVGPELDTVVDICIAITGILSGISGDVARFALAHGFHDAFSVVHRSHSMLHGEKVALGIILQLMLEGKENNDMRELCSFFESIGLPMNLVEAGVEILSDDEIDIVVDTMMSGSYVQTLQNLDLDLDLSRDNIRSYVRRLSNFWPDE